MMTMKMMSFIAMISKKTNQKMNRQLWAAQDNLLKASNKTAILNCNSSNSGTFSSKSNSTNKC